MLNLTMMFKLKDINDYMSANNKDINYVQDLINKEVKQVFTKVNETTLKFENDILDIFCNSSTILKDCDKNDYSLSVLDDLKANINKLIPVQIISLTETIF